MYLLTFSEFMEVEMNRKMRTLVLTASLLLALSATSVSVLAAPNPFVGMWESTDTDGSYQTLAIGGGPGMTHHFRYLDYGATVCGLGPGGEFLYKAFGYGTMTEAMLDGYPILTGSAQVSCLTSPPTPLPYLSGFAFTYDAATDTLTDQYGVVWSRK